MPFSLKIHSLRANSSRNNTYFAKIRQVTFDLPHSLPSRQDRFNHSRARRAGPVPGVARGDGKRAIEPCITEIQTHKINLELTCEQKKTYIRVNFTVGFQLRHHIIIS